MCRLSSIILNFYDFVLNLQINSLIINYFLFVTITFDKIN